MPKKYFQASIPIKVVEELQTAIDKHPELGFTSVSEAIKHAVVRFTESVKRQGNQGNDDERPLPNTRDVMAFLRRLAQEELKEPETKRGNK